MSKNRELTVDDFVRQPRGPYQFNSWLAKKALVTPMGKFEVRVDTDLKDRDPPDEVALRLANVLVSYAREGHGEILDKVYKDYLQASKDEDWLRSCNVPPRLSKKGILPFLYLRSLAVTRSKAGPKSEHSAVIYIIPAWDEEHGIYLKVRSGRLARYEP